MLYYGTTFILISSCIDPSLNSLLVRQKSNLFAFASQLKNQTWYLSNPMVCNAAQKQKVSSGSFPFVSVSDLTAFFPGLLIRVWCYLVYFIQADMQKQSKVLSTFEIHLFSCRISFFGFTLSARLLAKQNLGPNSFCLGNLAQAAHATTIAKRARTWRPV